MTFRDAFVQVNGLRLHYLDWGGDGQTVLFLHPTSFHAHVWDGYARALQPRFHCLSLDTRGHGDSDKPGVYGWTDFAADLQEFCAALGLRQVMGVGHSAGGTAIAVVASRRADIFAGTALLDPILFFGDRSVPGSTNNGLATGARRRRVDWPNREAILESYGSRPPFNAWDPECLELYVRHGVDDLPDGTVRLKCSAEDESEMYRWGPSRLPTEQILANVACPSLLVVGASSDALPPENARRAAGLLPRVTYISMPDSSHFVPFERPGQTITALARFLEDL